MISLTSWNYNRTWGWCITSFSLEVNLKLLQHLMPTLFRLNLKREINYNLKEATILRQLSLLRVRDFWVSRIGLRLLLLTNLLEDSQQLSLNRSNLNSSKYPEESINLKTIRMLHQRMFHLSETFTRFMNLLFLSTKFHRITLFITSLCYQVYLLT
jgi:hypothetical protein